jgi:hypothetical protein
MWLLSYDIFKFGKQLQLGNIYHIIRCHNQKPISQISTILNISNPEFCLYFSSNMSYKLYRIWQKRCENKYETSKGKWLCVVNVGRLYFQLNTQKRGSSDAILHNACKCNVCPCHFLRYVTLSVPHCGNWARTITSALPADGVIYNTPNVSFRRLCRLVNCSETFFKFFKHYWNPKSEVIGKEEAVIARQRRNKQVSTAMNQHTTI